jgi:mRNA interferase HigB
MHVITRKRLNEFAEKFPDTKSALVRWYATMKKGSFSNFAELHAVFPTADRVGKLTVVNIAFDCRDSLQSEKGLYPCRAYPCRIRQRPVEGVTHAKSRREQNGKRVVFFG